MANEPIYGLEALRRYREVQARKEHAAKEAAEAAAKEAAEAATKNQTWLKASVSAEERAKI